MHGYARGLGSGIIVTSLGDEDHWGLVYIKEKHARKYAQNVAFRLFAAASLFGLTDWLHMYLFYSSKV